MDITALTTLVSLLVTLSIASERLVEIFKGAVSSLIKWRKKEDGEIEWNPTLIQFLAVVAGCITAWLALPVVQPAIANTLVGIPDWLVILGVGLLTSGGSGFWNTILTYLLQVKDIKAVQADAMKQEKKDREKGLKPIAEAAPLPDDGNDKGRTLPSR